MNADTLIDLYLKDKGDSDVDTEFKRQLLKGNKVKFDTVSDEPKRDLNFSGDTDNSWMSSSSAPY